MDIAIDSLEKILKDGINAKLDKNGGTLLIRALYAQDKASVLQLIDLGADPNVEPKNGTRALHVAAAFGLEESAKALIAAGADILARDKQGKTARDLAEEFNNPKIAEILKEAEMAQPKLPAGRKPLRTIRKEIV